MTRLTSDNQQYTMEDGLSLKELILKIWSWVKYLLSNWIVIALAGAIGGTAGLYHAYSKKPDYVAELSFVLEEAQQGGGLGAYSGLASMVGIDLGGGSGGIFMGDNLVELMKSRSMVEKSLLTSVDWYGKQQTMAESYIDINNIREGWKKDPVLKDIYFLPGEDRSKFTRAKDSVLLGFCKGITSTNLSIGKKDKKLGIITITVKSKNELFSKYFAETLKKVVSNFYIETKTKKATENLNILQRQVDSVRRALNGAIQGVATSMDTNPNPNPARLILRVPSQSRQVEVQTNSAILQQLLPNLEMAKLTLRKETPLIQEIDTPILPLTKERVGRLKSLIIGGLLGGFFAVSFLLLRRFFKEIWLEPSPQNRSQV